jgi:GNAT superfamily N-acetyltransferase
VLLAYADEKPIGCAGLKRYSDRDVEIKRVWVEPEWRGKHIATSLMDLLEDKARQIGYKRAILQTRPIMPDAVGLYESRGYVLIDNYPPYDKLEGAICMALCL